MQICGIIFGSVDHEKLITMVAERVSDGRVLKLIRQMLEAGYVENGKRLPTPQGTPQGGVISPLFSNIYLTPFDDEMTRRVTSSRGMPMIGWCFAEHERRLSWHLRKRQKS